MREAAARIGGSHGKIGHWETGTNPVDVDALLALSNLYARPVLSFFADSVTGAEAIELMRALLEPKDQPRVERKRAGRA